MTHLEPFTPEQIAALDTPLPKQLVSTRKGSSKMLCYLEGHHCIDQANRIFGYGNWAYRTLECLQTVLFDPTTGEAVGIAYKAKVELTVRGALAPIVEVGSQPLASWNVQDTVMSRRKEGAEGPIQDWERMAAQRTIVEAHEHAEKGAVTDAMKRALRTFGSQFGNGLYGDGTANISQSSSAAEVLVPLKLAVKDLGLAKDGKEWIAWKASILGEAIPDGKLTSAQLAKLNEQVKRKLAA